MKSTRPQHLDITVRQPDSKRFHANDPIKYLINNTFNDLDEYKLEKLHRELLKNQFISISLLETIITKSSKLVKNNPKAIDAEILNNIISHTVESLIRLLDLSLDDQTEILINDISSIRHLFYHLGTLAKAGASFPPLPNRVIQLLLNDFLNVRAEDYFYIGNTLVYGLGLLGKYNKINGMIDSSPLLSLLMLVNEHSESNYFALSHSLYGMGTLAENKHIKGHIKADTLESIINQVSSRIDISTGMYGIALIIDNNNIDGMISDTCINQAMHRFNSQPKKICQEASNLVYSLGLFAFNKKIQGTINHHNVIDMIRSVPISHHDPMHARQTLFGISLIAKHNNPDLARDIPANLIRQLAASVTNKHQYLHPARAAAFITQLSVFSIHAKELNDVFKHFCNAITVSLRRLSVTQQAQMQNTLATLQLTCPAWHSMLSSRLYPTSNKKEASNAMDVEVNAAHTANPHQATLFSHANGKINKSNAANTQKTKFTLKTTSPRPLAVTKKTPMQIKPSTHTSLLKQNQIRDLINKRDIRGLSKLLNTKESHPVTAPRSYQHHDNQPQISKLFKTHVTTAHQDSFPKEAIVIQFFKDTDAETLNELAKNSSHIYFDLLMKACSPHTRYQLFMSQKMHPVLLNLSINELTSFIEKLISPIMIYRDHHAVLRIYDALAIRADMQPAHQKSINIMATNLVNRAVEFHDACEHPHVIERLKGLSDLDSWILQEDVKETNSTTTSSATKSDTTVSVPSSNNTINNIVNIDYQYDTEDVEAILRARINQGLASGTLHGSINILASVQLHHLVPGNRVEDVLSDFLLSNQQNHNGCALLPIHVNAGHWVGLKLEIRDNKICHMTYFNSSLDPEADHIRCDLFFNALKNAGLLHEHANLQAITIAMTCMQQDDPTSCGAYMIENFYCALKNMQWDKLADLTAQIRHRHLQSLHAENPDYYRHFFAKQHADKNKVPDLTTQLISHQVLPASSATHEHRMFNHKVLPEQDRKPGLNNTFRR